MIRNRLTQTSTLEGAQQENKKLATSQIRMKAKQMKNKIQLLIYSETKMVMRSTLLKGLVCSKLNLKSLSLTGSFLQETRYTVIDIKMIRSTE